MAKKKRITPKKKCPACGTEVAIATKTCPQCQAIFPAKAKPGRKKKGRPPGTTVKLGRPPGSGVKPGSDLDSAIRFVEQTGGLKAAKAAIARIEQIKNL